MSGFEEKNAIDGREEQESNDECEGELSELESEEEELFSRSSSILKSNTSLDGADEEFVLDLDHLRNETESSKRFSIMAEPLMDEESPEPGGEVPSEEVQMKRQSIRMSSSRVKSKSHKKCTFIRESGTLSSKFYPNYLLSLDDEDNRLLIGARKLTRNKTASYYLFDMSIEKDLNKCTKDSPNLIGKLTKKTQNCTELVLARDNDEFLGIVFFKPKGTDEFFSGAHPRNMSGIIPALDAIGNTVPHEVGASGIKSLNKIVADGDSVDPADYNVLKTKEPIFYNGCYRLHFLGKSPVVPSVKNFQLVPNADPTRVAVQFVKLSDDKYRLDYEAPVTAAQAFCFALAQFSKL